MLSFFVDLKFAFYGNNLLEFRLPDPCPEQFLDVAPRRRSGSLFLSFGRQKPPFQFLFPIPGSIHGPRNNQVDQKSVSRPSVFLCLFHCFLSISKNTFACPCMYSLHCRCSHRRIRPRGSRPHVPRQEHPDPHIHTPASRNTQIAVVRLYRCSALDSQNCKCS